MESTTGEACSRAADTRGRTWVRLSTCDEALDRMVRPASAAGGRSDGGRDWLDGWLDGCILSVRDVRLAMTGIFG